MSLIYRCFSASRAFSGASLKNEQVFFCPTYDRIPKYILSEDEAVRIDVLKAFSGISSLSSAKQLDGNYNSFDDLPSSRNHSTVDFLCETEFGDITIEFQVVKQDYWDKRALANIASIYGRSGGQYMDIENVIGIHLLRDGSTPYWKDGKFIRDYTLVDQITPKNKIPALRLVQYSLGDADLNHPDLKENENLRQWIEFFKSAHEKKSPPPAIGDCVKKAYDMIRIDTLKSQRPELLTSSEDFFFLFANLTEHDEAVKEKVKEEIMIEIAKNCLKDGVNIASVARYSGLSEEQIRRLV